MTADQRRAAAGYVSAAYELSQRQACRALGISRSTARYARRQRPDEPPLTRDIRRLANKHPRWGYRRVHALLREGGWEVNIKRVRRLWAEMGLKRPPRRRKARKLGPKTGSSVNSCVNKPARFKDDVWAYDFVADRTGCGGRLKWLTLVDEYTRECLALHVDSSLKGEDVRRVLGRVVGWRGAPRRIRSDNGSEFICEALRQWLPLQGTEAIPVAPGRPWENGYSESFNSRLRDEFLEFEEFESVKDARAKAGWYRRLYNTVRPHSALGYRTPKQFSEECCRKKNGRAIKSKSENDR